MPSSTVTATSEALGRSRSIFANTFRRLRLSFPPETATAILSLKLSIPYLAMLPLTFASMDSVKHFLQSLSPEYGLKKKASLRLHRVQTAAAAFPLIRLFPFTQDG